ncbi:MAG: hypothetical protein RL003_1247, partial [Bacteroidota bacterium]
MDGNPQPPIGYYLDTMSAEDYASVALIFEQGIEGGNATYDTEAAAWEDWDKKHLQVGRFVVRSAENKQVLG